MSDLIPTPEEFIPWSQKHGKEFTIQEGTGDGRTFRINGPNNDALIDFLTKLFAIQKSFSVIFSDTGEQQKHFRIEKAGGPHNPDSVFQAREVS